LPLNDIVGLKRDLHKFLISNDEWNIIKELCRVFKVSFIIVIIIVYFTLINKYTNYNF